MASFSSKVSGFFGRIDKTNVSPASLVVLLASVVFVRILLEFTLEAQKTVQPFESLVLFFLYFSSVMAGLVLLIWLFSGRSILSALKIVAFFSPLLWLPPFLDLVWSGGSGFDLTFVFSGTTFVGALGSFCAQCAGVSVGLKVEVALTMLVAAAYVFFAHRSPMRALGVAAAVYLFVLVQAFWPGFLMARLGHSYTDVFLYREVLSSYALALTAVAVGALALLAPRREPFLKSLRASRALHYVGMAVFGAAVGGSGWQHAWPGVLLPLASVLAAVFCAFQAAVLLNDYYDRHIDRRQGASFRVQVPWKQVAFWSALAVLDAWAAGYAAAVAVLFALALSVAYSMPPLRLRRHVVPASVVLAGCSLAVFLSGFGVGLARPENGGAPLQLILLVFGFVLLASPFKDLKDAEGDRQNGVFTLASWLGADSARPWTALLVGLAVLWATGLSGLSWPIGLAFGLAGFAAVWTVHDSKRMEQIVFVLDYAFLALLAGHLSSIWVLA